nr:hypothetical protein [Phascolarctobacterium sp.]
MRLQVLGINAVMSGNNIYFIPAPNTCGNGCISAYNIQTIGSFGVKPSR